MIECEGVLDYFTDSFLPFDVFRLVDKKSIKQGSSNGYIVQYTGEGIASDKKVLLEKAELIISYKDIIDIKKNDIIIFNNLQYEAILVERSIYGGYRNAYIKKQSSMTNI